MLMNSEYLILPSYSAITKITLSHTLSPVLEQHNIHFLMYNKHTFNLLSLLDKTVKLMVDEIHLKPYFDYKRSNVVGAAFDRPDAATSAFVFMLSSQSLKM